MPDFGAGWADGRGSFPSSSINTSLVDVFSIARALPPDDNARTGGELGWLEVPIESGVPFTCQCGIGLEEVSLVSDARSGLPGSVPGTVGTSAPVTDMDGGIPDVLGVVGALPPGAIA